jgi:hypothetical protein
MRERVKVFVNQSNLVIRSMGDLDNVDLTNNEDGALLIYDSEIQKFISSKTLDGITLNNVVITGGSY